MFDIEAASKNASHCPISSLHLLHKFDVSVKHTYIYIYKCKTNFVPVVSGGAMMAVKMSGTNSNSIEHLGSKKTKTNELQ